MKIKVTIMSLIAVMLGLFVNNVTVSALENDENYTNQNGVELTEKEYEYVNEFYGPNFFDTMTQEDYEWIAVLDIDNSDVEISSYIELPAITPLSTVHGTASKKLTISKACSNSACIITLNNQWLVNPTIRSWDVIGARFVNTQLVNNATITTKVASSAGSSYYYTANVFSNGIGKSVDLPDTATNIRVEQQFSVTTGGTVFGSYQHATSNIDYYTSILYTIAQGGYGSVFSFYGNAIGKYDQMGGVEINV